MRKQKADSAPKDWNDEVDALASTLRGPGGRQDRAWLMLVDYRAKHTIDRIAEVHHVTIDEAHKLIQAALRASRPPMVVGADPL